MRRLPVSLCIAMSLAVVATQSPAEVVFDNGAPDQQHGFFASSNYEYVTVATRIRVGDGGLSFNGMTWWGGYHPGNTLPADESFSLTVYDPSLTLLVSRSMVDQTRQATANLVQGQYQEYVYSGLFPRVDLAAGDYFIGLSALETGAQDRWFWETTSGAAIAEVISYSPRFGWYDTPAVAALAFQATSVPEIDPAGMGSVIALVAGALAARGKSPR